MSDGTFSVREESVEIESDQLSPLEKRLRELLVKIRAVINATLGSRTLLIPGILNKPTLVTLYFEDDQSVDVAAFLTYQNRELSNQIFFIPQRWTNVQPQGCMSISAAVTILENFYITIVHPQSPLLRFEGMFSENDVAHAATLAGNIAHEQTAVAHRQ